MSLATTHSVFRERMFEHQLLFDWRRDQASLEVSQPAIDNSGHDSVLEARGVTRYVQLKTSWITARARSQNVQLGLASKPSGCVLWMLLDENRMECSSYLFFGAGPGKPLPPTADFMVARHTRANKKASPWVVTALGLHWLLVDATGSVTIFAPDHNRRFPPGWAARSASIEPKFDEDAIAAVALGRNLGC